MFVHLKQSGELLASQGQPGELWTPEGVRASTEKVATAWRHREALGLRGLLLVSGAGNVIRGEKLMAQGIANGYADALGRLATIQNTLVLAAALKDREVPHRTFIAPTMELDDIALHGNDMAQYSLDGVREAYERNEVVLVAGGMGEDNKTTDSAVLHYAAQHAAAYPDEEVIVLKGTKYDGVYDRDPAKDGRAKRYSEVTAGYMLANYDRMPAVDRSSLKTINDSGVALRVYRDNQHDLTQVIHSGEEIGTSIVPGYADTNPTLAS